MRRNYFFGFIAVLVISFLVLYWDLSQTNFNALLASSKNINYGFIILILLVILCTYFCEAAILFVLSGKQKFIDLLHFYRVPLIQALFNAITPMATGGQPAQLIALKQMKIEFGCKFAFTDEIYNLSIGGVFCLYLGLSYWASIVRRNEAF
ncbi:lysylphosphatidylglycerol synthase domain-containing protein [Lactobacillus mulieris]|nr:lysylphosphatidylglycerol synthase domain-containing protein [Lactobacillus mulieris]